MRSANSKACVCLIIVATSASLPGCVPPPLPSPDEVAASLSDAVLHPERTCEELRAEFDVEHLPAPSTPADIHLPYTEDWLELSTGERIRLWHLPVDDSHGTVIYSIGAVGEMACYLLPGLMLTQSGYSMVIYEYAGFGESTGAPTLKSLEPTLHAVVNWTLENTDADEVSLMGLSLGSIPAIAVAIDRPDDVNAVILDSPVAMGRELDRFNFFLGGRAREITRLLSPELVSEDIIAEMKQPLLMYMHEEDFVTPPETIRLLYDLAGGPKELVRFAELDHGRGQFVHAPEYKTALIRFLDEIWGIERDELDPYVTLDGEIIP